MPTLVTSPEVFLTDNIYEASYLLASGFRFLGTKETGSNYKTMMFEHTPELEKAILEFNNNASAPLLTFINSYKRLKTSVFRGSQAYGSTRNL